MERIIHTKFFTFNQTNSGGEFIIDEKEGVGEYVIIEALSAKEAIRKFEEIGDKVLFFDSSCPCCGDRWSTWIDDSDGTEQPTIYGDIIEDYKNTYLLDKRAFVHYINGNIVKHTLKKQIGTK